MTKQEETTPATTLEGSQRLSAVLGENGMRVTNQNNILVGKYTRIKQKPGETIDLSAKNGLSIKTLEIFVETGGEELWEKGTPTVTLEARGGRAVRNPDGSVDYLPPDDNTILGGDVTVEWFLFLTGFKLRHSHKADPVKEYHYRFSVVFKESDGTLHDWDPDVHDGSGT